MPTVYTTTMVHLHNPEPGSTTVRRIDHGPGSFILLDFTGGEVGTPDVSALFPTYESARRWVSAVLAAVIEAECDAHLAQLVADEIGAPV